MSLPKKIKILCGEKCINVINGMKSKKALKIFLKILFIFFYSSNEKSQAVVHYVDDVSNMRILFIKSCLITLLNLII